MNKEFFQFCWDLYLSLDMVINSPKATNVKAIATLGVVHEKLFKKCTELKEKEKND